MHQRFFRPNYIFNNDAYFLDFRAQKFPLIFFNVNPFKHQQALHFGVLNYEKQHKEGTCKVSGRSIVFSAFYADFCLCPKLVIITTLMIHFLNKLVNFHQTCIDISKQTNDNVNFPYTKYLHRVVAILSAIRLNSGRIFIRLLWTYTVELQWLWNHEIMFEIGVV